MLTNTQLSDFAEALKKLFNLPEDYDTPVTVLKMKASRADFRLDLPIPASQALLFKELYVSVDMEPPEELELRVQATPIKVVKLASSVRLSYWWVYCDGGRNGHYLNQYSHFLWQTKEFW